MAWYYTEPRPGRRPLDPVPGTTSGGGGGPPTGPAGGDLTGSYPDPTLAANAVGQAELVDGAVTDPKIASVSYAKVTGAPPIPTTLPPSGPASGDLTGTYPAPTIAAGAVGNAEITDVAYAKVTGAPTSLPPSGAAGGDLAGTYPNPDIKALAVGTPELAAGAVTDAKVTDVTWGKITGAPASLPPSGTAGGDLTGSYPNPTIAKLNGAAVGTTTPLARGDVLVAQGTTPTVSRLALGAGNTTLRSNGVDAIWAVNAPGGGAGGDLGGNYPNPTVGRLNGAQLGLTTPLARGDLLVANATPALTRLGVGATGTVLQSNGTDAVWGTPPGGPPSGAAGGDLTGTYPNPTLAAGAVGTADIGNLQVTDAKIADVAWGKVTGAPTALPPSGPAGGDLAGTYPNPTVAAGAVGNAEISDVAYAKVTGAPTSLPPSGAASGDLSGTYPGPQIAAGVIVDADVNATAAIQGTKLADAPNGIPTAKLNDLAVTDAKIAGVAYGKVTGTPTALPPSGAASGDLGGTYPGPTVAKVNGATVGTTTPLARGDLLVANATPALVRLARGTVNQVLQSNGTDVVWGPAPATGGPPTGAAGGSLAGSYPNPTLATTGVTAGTYGTARKIAQVTVNAEGRVTAIVEVTLVAQWK
jgi:hypothetical protein